MPDKKTENQTPEQDGAKSGKKESKRPAKDSAASGTADGAKGKKSTEASNPGSEEAATEAPAKPGITRLKRSVGIGLPSGKYRIFLGRGAIPPVTESKTFVARLKKVDTVEIAIFEGDEETVESNEFVGEVGLKGVKLREDEKAEIEISFILDTTGTLVISLADKIGGVDGIARFVMPQFGGLVKGSIDFNSLPVEELSLKIDLLDEQMGLLKGELSVRRVGE